ncbi:hypothetical protein OOT46_00970 [Aquabacterium sp. A7-Y]|uniref:hypothetical protein n=1 Tax=Aquabacterium sp. A7-Y TaxID=1349605 RepID=UPI00223D23E9|nr:hypothetical protein [Aquabacterium sp. A7-Y]MCW7536426.1 hypothetical protein [Aquabacterium sp. A7-Y]
MDMHDRNRADRDRASARGERERDRDLRDMGGGHWAHSQGGGGEGQDDGQFADEYDRPYRPGAPSRSYGGHAGGGQEGGGSYGGGQRDFYLGAHHDPDFQQWRSEHARALDEDYRRWREERYKQFSEEFDQWRRIRQSGPDKGGPGSSGAR